MTLGKIIEEQKKEIIELSLPVNPAYVSSARLTATSIANRMGFDIECTEDIKSAVSEACAYLIHKKASCGVTVFKIVFSITDWAIEIFLSCEKGKSREGDGGDKYGIKMIKALMDDARLLEEGNEFSIYMIKKKHTL